GDFKFIGEKLLRSIVDQKTKNSILIDMRAVINSLHRPIFFLPFPKEFIFDIIFGRIILLYVLDLDGYIELYKKAGYNAVWASRKETMRTKELGLSKDILTVENKGIKVELAEGEIWVAHGSITKIFFVLIYPSY